MLRQFGGADLTDAVLEYADLSGANMLCATLNGARFSHAQLMGTSLAGVDLSLALGLDAVVHLGPSTVGLDTLAKSKGKIPAEFLSGCGLVPWEILHASVYAIDLSIDDLNRVQDALFDRFRVGPLRLGTVFVSYSWSDGEFVDKLQARLNREGARVWRDKHDLVAGPIQPQVAAAIRKQEAVILVLSQNSIRSDWVENELEMARRREREIGSAYLCPVALDDVWKTKLVDSEANRFLWRTLTDKMIVDFSQSDNFESSFGKLIRGLSLYYGRATRPDATGPIEVLRTS